MPTANLSNPDLRKAGEKTSYTKEEMKQLKKSSVDPIYFIKNFVKIQHPTKGAVPLKLYDYQHEIIQSFHDHNQICLISSRQSGKTTCSMAYLLWFAMFNDDKTILITANKLSSALEIMDRIRYAYEALPKFIKAGVKEFNKGSIVFDNKSRIVCRATTKDSGRGLSISILYCLAGETTVTVRNKKTGEIKEISLEELYNDLGK